MGVIAELIRELRIGAARAKRTKDRSGKYDTTMVYMAIPAHIALMAADRLDMTESRVASEARDRAKLRDLASVAEDAMRDTVLRFTYAVTDLEFLLMDVIGRQPMTMQEVREQRQIMESKPSPGPQPFIRKRPSIPISEELKRSIRQGRIGNPREPGEEG
jgi:hypothetical protein